MIGTIERFHKYSGEYLAVSDVPVVGLDDLLTGDFEWPGGQPVLLASCLYDIAPTIIRALRNLQRVAPSSSAFVFGTPRTIREVSEAQTGIALVGVTDMVNETQRAFGSDVLAERFISAGCEGILLGNDNAHILPEYPDVVFYKRGA
jgi:hypothetical protein